MTNYEQAKIAKTNGATYTTIAVSFGKNIADDLFAKANPYHDEKGRFTSGGGGRSGAGAGHKSVAARKAYDKAEEEKDKSGEWAKENLGRYTKNVWQQPI